MKLETDRMPVKEPAIKEDTSKISLPLGLVGFPEITEAEIVFVEEELPFMRLHSSGEAQVHFLVLNPMGILPDYEIELVDQDIAYLGIQSAEDVLLLNIATVHASNPLKISVNLIGPIVINRKTRVGKQVVIGNHMDFSARHMLFEEPAAEA